MNKYLFVGAAALLACAAQGPAQAQAKAGEATPLTSLTQDQKDHGVQTFSLLASAMQSPNVPDKIKSVLMGCMYENSIGKISEAVDGVIKDNPGKIDRTKPDQVVGVIARICGYQPDPADAAAPAPAPKTPAPSTAKPKGR